MCREWRYADHIFIQIYFRMHHFAVKFSKIFIASGGKGALTPLTKILRTPVHSTAVAHHSLVATRCQFAPVLQGTIRVPIIITNDTIKFFSLTAIGVLVISNHNSVRVPFDKIASVGLYVLFKFM